MQQYRPDRKITAAAIATIVLWVVQATTSLDVSIGVEGAVAVVAAYFMPLRKATNE